MPVHNSSHVAQLVRRLPQTLYLALAIATGAGAQEPSVERLAGKLNQIVDPRSTVERLADTPGAGTREGPVWVTQRNYLLYVDRSTVPKVNIVKWDPLTAKVTIFMEDTGADGLTLDKQGRLVWADNANGTIVRADAEGKRVVLARESAGRPLEAPNDLVYRSDGSLFFSDFGHYPRQSGDVPAVYVLNNGQVRLLVRDIPMPNGLAFTPDEKYLYVNDSSEKMTIMKYKVNSDGSLADGRMFIGMNPDGNAPRDQFPDGLKVDRQGNVYCTGPGGVWIISPQGQHLGTIRNVNRPANFTFGDADGKTLYITSRPGLFRVRVMIEGTRP